MAAGGKVVVTEPDKAFARLCLMVIKADVIHLAIDDTLTLRSSRKAPGSKYHHQHENKPNLPNYVWGQCWVSLAMIASRADKTTVSMPLL